MHPRTEQLAAELARAGAAGQVRELAASTRTAAEAADALGCPLGAIASSLVFFADDEPVLVMTSGAHRVDTAHVAAQLGVSALRRAGAEEVRAVTGQPIGGVSPLGHPQPVRTLVDTALDAFPVVWAAAGTPHAVFSTTAEELRRLCSAEPVDVVA